MPTCREDPEVTSNACKQLSAPFVQLPHSTECYSSCLHGDLGNFCRQIRNSPSNAFHAHAHSRRTDHANVRAMKEASRVRAYEQNKVSPNRDYRRAAVACRKSQCCAGQQRRIKSASTSEPLRCRTWGERHEAPCEILFEVLKWSYWLQAYCRWAP